MYKLVVLLFLFGCQSSVGDIKPLNFNFDEVSIDVVEKELIINTDTPSQMDSLLTNWFNNKVKVNGFQGKVLFEISKYEEITSNIENGKKVEVDLALNIHIDTKDQFSNQTSYQIKLNEFGTITGSFSLSEVDTLKKNLQKKIVSNLTKTINSKI